MTLLKPGEQFCVGQKANGQTCLEAVPPARGLCPDCVRRLSPETRGYLEKQWTAPRRPVAEVCGLKIDNVEIAELTAALELLRLSRPSTWSASWRI